MIALPANEQEDCSLCARHCPQTERQWWPMEGRGSVIPDGNSALFANNVERKLSNPLAHLRAARSFLDRTRGAAIPDHCGVTVLRRCNRFAGPFSKSAIEEF